MSSEADLATAVATELVKQVPIKEVYKDGFSPAVQQTGSALTDFVGWLSRRCNLRRHCRTGT
jgi:hypothetical protein